MAIYKNDCDDCKYLGEFEGHDLYFCNKGNIYTIIARYGNEPEEHMSGLEFGRPKPQNTILGVAYAMSQAKGYL